MDFTFLPYLEDLLDAFQKLANVPENFQTNSAHESNSDEALHAESNLSIDPRSSVEKHAQQLASDALKALLADIKEAHALVDRLPGASERSFTQQRCLEREMRLELKQKVMLARQMGMTIELSNDLRCRTTEDTAISRIESEGKIPNSN